MSSENDDEVNRRKPRNHIQQCCDMFNLVHVRDVTWAHAVNSIEKLTNALAHAHFVEADVQFFDGRAVMAHDFGQNGPSFESWLDVILNSTRRVGVKLDFKDIRAHRLALETLRVSKLLQSVPVWLNADVVRGPNGWDPVIPAAQFVTDSVRICPEATLSLGWTTGSNLWAILIFFTLPALLLFPFVVLSTSYLPLPTGISATLVVVMTMIAYYITYSRVNMDTFTYTENMVDEMLHLCADVEQCTFAVRECFVSSSWDQLSRLLNASTSHSLTVWGSSRRDIVDRKVWRAKVGDAPVFVDVLEPLLPKCCTRCQSDQVETVEH